LGRYRGHSPPGLLPVPSHWRLKSAAGGPLAEFTRDLADRPLQHHISQMDADQIARLAYLGLLTAALGGWLLLQLRSNPGRSLQMLSVWALIFVGVIAAYGLWHEIRRDIAPTQTILSQDAVAVPRAADGHFHVALLINDVPVRFIVDTGASDIVLSRRDAARIGMDPATLAYTGIAQTANGTVRSAPVRLDRVQLGQIVDQDVRAVVNEAELDVSLLGMRYLNGFSRIEIAGDELVLMR
jgi:aspartyl protease family protein